MYPCYGILFYIMWENLPSTLEILVHKYHVDGVRDGLSLLTFSQNSPFSTNFEVNVSLCFLTSCCTLLFKAVQGAKKKKDLKVFNKNLGDGIL